MEKQPSTLPMGCCAVRVDEGGPQHQIFDYFSGNGYNNVMQIEPDRFKTPGEMLRYWRTALHLSQMDLSVLAGVSTRHLSFIENGRANASRNMLLRLGRALRLNFRQQNLLLNLGGYTEEYPEPALEDPAMAPVWDAISQMLNQHEPYPAVVVRPDYEIIWSNHGFQKLVAALAGEGTVERFPNLIRLAFAPGGLRPYFEDWERVRAALLARLYEEVRITRRAGPRLLYEELAGDDHAEMAPGIRPTDQYVLPFTLVKGDLLLRMFSTTTAFSFAASVTVQEMRIESLFPADGESRERYLQRFDRKR